MACVVSFAERAHERRRLFAQFCNVEEKGGYNDGGFSYLHVWLLQYLPRELACNAQRRTSQTFNICCVVLGFYFNHVYRVCCVLIDVVMTGLGDKPRSEGDLQAV